MTATTINHQTAPTPESVREALALLKVFAERKSTGDNDGKMDWDSFFKSDIFKTIEAALKSCAEAKSKDDDGEHDSENDDRTVTRRKRHIARTAVLDKDDDEEEEEEDKEEEDEEDGENPFSDSYYWNPGPEWKTIGLVAGGAALFGLGALLYKLFDD